MSELVLKELVYRCRNFPGKIAYLVTEHDVYFTGLLPTPIPAIGTIQSAEAVIEAICEAENIDWRTHTFFDIETQQQYTYWAIHGYDDYVVERLVIEGDELQVSGWETVAAHPEHGGAKLKTAVGIPFRVFELFRPYIYADLTVMQHAAGYLVGYLQLPKDSVTQVAIILEGCTPDRLQLHMKELWGKTSYLTESDIEKIRKVRELARSCASGIQIGLSNDKSKRFISLYTVILIWIELYDIPFPFRLGGN